MNRDCPNSEWFEQLCALSAIGELSPAEKTELELHLSTCEQCRTAYADFHRIAAYDIGLAVIRRSAQEVQASGGRLDEKRLLTRMLERAAREKPSPRAAFAARTQAPQTSRATRWAGWKWLTNPLPATIVLVLLVLGVTGLGAYRYGQKRLSPAIERLRNQVVDWQARNEQTAKAEGSQAKLLKRSESERDTLVRLLAHSQARLKALKESLADAQARYVALASSQTSLRAQSSAAKNQAEQLSRDLQLAQDDEVRQSHSLAALRAQVQAAQAKLSDQQTLVSHLQNELRNSEEFTAAESSSYVGDKDAAELLGARDLHIVDVYDVEGSGRTRRTYGRVFYVAGKLLVFYAFDLQDRAKKREAVAFQAWGYSDTDMNKPENLGLFHLDDAKIGRWALKVHNPVVLQRIDAVFVTLEPPHGSPFPRGPKLLYADLAGPPNHP